MATNGHNGNGHGHVTETPDVSHIKNIDVTHEVSDVELRGIAQVRGRPDSDDRGCLPLDAGDVQVSEHAGRDEQGTAAVDQWR